MGLGQCREGVGMLGLPLEMHGHGFEMEEDEDDDDDEEDGDWCVTASCCRIGYVLYIVIP